MSKMSGKSKILSSVSLVTERVEKKHIRFTLKSFFKYLVPSMFTMMLMAVYTFTDTYVVGQKLGAVALGAVGVCTPVLIL